MEAKIQISDEIYAKLLNGNKRIKGSLALVNPQEGNFHAYQKTWKPTPGTQTYKLNHGKVSLSETDMRMTLHVKGKELDDSPFILMNECRLADTFLRYTLSMML